MNSWVSIVVLLALVIAVGLLRERWRVSRIEGWARDKGFSRQFPVPAGGPQPAGAMVKQLAVHGARIWGMVLDGTIDGVPVTIAEHESSEPARQSGIWCTIVTWPVAGATGRIVMQRGTGSRLVADALKAVTDPIRSAVADALDLPGAATHLTIETPEGWAVYGEPVDRDRWLTPDKIRELDAWPHGGAFARQDGFGGWRVKEPITADTLARLLDQLPVARRLLQ